MSIFQEILLLGPVNFWPDGCVIASEESLKSSLHVGIIRKNLTRFPDGIVLLTDLKGLGLHENKLSTVPDSFTKLIGLTHLRLDTNELSSLPAEIRKLTNLQHFECSKNKLSSVPDSITKLTGLTDLRLFGNELSSLPAGIGSLLNLKYLGLRTNKLSSVPESIGNLTNLTSLTLSENPIIELPQSIARLQSLKEFLIEWQGRIKIQRAPVGITSVPCYVNNQRVEHWGNNMTMAFSEALKRLKLYSNHANTNLTNVGSLIPGWRLCHQIDLSNNMISALPEDLTRLSNMCEIDIANNTFATFPDVLLKMSWLTSINISGNSFTDLPEGITKLVNLSNIVIVSTEGKISIRRAPLGISTLPCFNANADLKLLNFWLSSFHENKGLEEIDAIIGKWCACERISIAYNQISMLPDGLSRLTSLRDLNLASNKFTKIPDVLLQMSWLISLNIAGNFVSLFFFCFRSYLII
eukprot:TRINITY_DN4080_c0_g1_i7.p1 TRINITY_DN4080_c0_g1~~TRINITY_DN4080_c0_g1_i7.p1  ORF type:complete len:467 (+),score=83.17 TRINITY_DN4080_c0_g1_i7:59-1459(+)